jgi:O-antigen ligase
MASIGTILRTLNARFSLVFAWLIGLGLVIAPFPIWVTLFYLTIPALVLWRIGAGWRPPLEAPVLLGIAMIIWSIMAIGWGYDPSGHGNSAAQWFANGCMTLIFFLGWLIAAGEKGGTERLETALVAGCVINAVCTLARHFIWHPDVLRMWGWGLTGLPVLGAAIMAVLFVLTLDRVISARGPKWPQIAALCIFGTFLLLSGSRGPILAVAAALLYLLVGQPLKIWAWIAGLGAAVLAVLALAEPSTIWQTIQIALDRGDDKHAQIWRDAVTEIAKRPFLGYGPQARLPVIVETQVFPFPHDLYLSLLFYSGSVGLLLFAAFAVSCFRRLGRAHRGYTALCLVPLIAGLTDLSQIIKGPAAIWYIVWVPFLLAICVSPQKVPARVPLRSSTRPDIATVTSL